MLLVVLEVDHVWAAESPDPPLGRPANDLAGGPGTDHRLLGLTRHRAQRSIELAIRDAAKARFPDLRDPPHRALAAERHLDTGSGELLAEVERLDDAVHVELAEVEY